MMNIREDSGSFPKNNTGFTLVELMITMVISGIIIAAVYSAYVTQQRIYLAQEQVAEMQQNIRAAMDMLNREIRIAGYDPTGNANAGVTVVSEGQISFSADINENGIKDTDEIIDFGFSAASGNDADPRDGMSDTSTAGVPNPLDISRQTGGAGGYQAIAENFQAIEFHGLDSNGNPTTIPADVRTVQVSLLARAGQPDQNFLNTATYCPASNPINPATGNCTNMAGKIWGPYKDHFRRRLLITNVELRNIGI